MLGVNESDVDEVEARRKVCNLRINNKAMEA